MVRFKADRPCTFPNPRTGKSRFYEAGEPVPVPDGYEVPEWGKIIDEPGNVPEPKPSPPEPDPEPVPMPNMAKWSRSKIDAYIEDRYGVRLDGRAAKKILLRQAEQVARWAKFFEV